MTDNALAESTDVEESAPEKEKSFFGRGALIGLVGGALTALLLISVAGSVISLVDDLFGSSTAAAAEEQVPVDPIVAEGESLASSNGCVACHSTNGVDGVGPTWKGIGELRDEAHLRESILDPNAVITEGFAADQMPNTFADTLSDADLDALIAYLQSL